jgi:transcription termination/antitermination protein NusA
MAKLFMQEVPEIYDNIIEIKAVARDPGSRAKIAVLSHDSSIDPIGACVGMRGSRVQAVVQELQGEKVDIIPWSNDTANFIVNALAPAEVSKVLMDEDKNKTEVVVPDDQLSLAIGRRGQNVKLASQLTGWEIDIMTEAEESERRQKDTLERTELFKATLDVDDVIAHLLVAEGYASVEDISDSAVEDLAGVEGFDEEIATELQRRGREYIEKRDSDLATRLAELGIDESLRATEGITLAMLVALGEKGVKTSEDLADLASDELREIVGESAMDNDTANAIIMKAREHWFADEAPAEGAGDVAKA